MAQHRESVWTLNRVDRIAVELCTKDAGHGKTLVSWVYRLGYKLHINMTSLHFPNHPGTGSAPSLPQLTIPQPKSNRKDVTMELFSRGSGCEKSSSTLRWWMSPQPAFVVLMSATLIPLNFLIFIFILRILIWTLHTMVLILISGSEPRTSAKSMSVKLI